MNLVLYGLFLQGCRYRCFIWIRLVTKVPLQISVLNLPLCFVDAVASEMVISCSEVRRLVHCASGIRDGDLLQ